MMTHGTAAAGMNATVDGTTAGSSQVICLESSGNVKAGILDMDELTGGDSCGSTAPYSQATERVGVHGFKMYGVLHHMDNLVSFAFMFTHPAKAHLAGNGTCSSQDCYGEHAIAVDIMNFDQDNSTKSHNAIYRMEAVETGDDTGVFTGTVAYAIMNNSTSQDAAAGTDPGGSSGFTRGGHRR